MRQRENYWQDRNERIEEELDREQAQAQASDLFTLQRAKEILARLWKDSRIDMYVRTEGEVALSAALYAVENPNLTKITKRIGAIAAGEQWAREQEAKNREF